MNNQQKGSWLSWWGREKRTTCWSNCKDMGHHSSKLLIKEQGKNKCCSFHRSTETERGLGFCESMHPSATGVLREMRFSAWNTLLLASWRDPAPPESSNKLSLFVRHRACWWGFNRVVDDLSDTLGTHWLHRWTQRLLAANACDFLPVTLTVTDRLWPR